MPELLFETSTPVNLQPLQPAVSGPPSMSPKELAEAYQPLWLHLPRPVPSEVYPCRSSLRL